jgi:hypothetical protein
LRRHALTRNASREGEVGDYPIRRGFLESKGKLRFSSQRRFESF